MSGTNDLTTGEREVISDKLTACLYEHEKGLEWVAEVILRLIRKRRKRVLIQFDEPPKSQQPRSSARAFLLE